MSLPSGPLIFAVVIHLRLSRKALTTSCRSDGTACPPDRNPNSVAINLRRSRARTKRTARERCRVDTLFRRRLISRSGIRWRVWLIRLDSDRRFFLIAWTNRLIRMYSSLWTTEWQHRYPRAGRLIIFNIFNSNFYLKIRRRLISHTFRTKDWK